MVRDGRHFAISAISEVTHAVLISQMVGRDMENRFARTAGHATDNVVLRVTSLHREYAFRDVSFALRKGEIICFSGLVGARRTDVALALFGIAPADGGTIEIEGQEVEVSSPKAAKGLGIAYVSEDRRKLGIAMAESVVPNITLATLEKYARRLGIVDRGVGRADTVR